jgi:hypothetical protein
MGMSTNTFSKWLLKVAVVALLAVPAAAQAQSADMTRVNWMATSSSEAALAGNDFGRLTMANGMLAFQSAKYEWRLALADVKRVAPSKQVSDALEIEAVTGQVFYVGILNGQLSLTSPGKAVQTIQRGVKTAPPAPVAPVRTALSAAGGGSQR